MDASTPNNGNPGIGSQELKRRPSEGEINQTNRINNLDQTNKKHKIEEEEALRKGLEDHINGRKSLGDHIVTIVQNILFKNLQELDKTLASGSADQPLQGGTQQLDKKQGDIINKVFNALSADHLHQFCEDLACKTRIEKEKRYYHIYFYRNQDNGLQISTAPFTDWRQISIFPVKLGNDGKWEKLNNDHQLAEFLHNSVKKTYSDIVDESVSNNLEIYNEDLTDPLKREQKTYSFLPILFRFNDNMWQEYLAEQSRDVPLVFNDEEKESLRKDFPQRLLAEKGSILPAIRKLANEYIPNMNSALSPDQLEKPVSYNFLAKLSLNVKMTFFAAMAALRDTQIWARDSWQDTKAKERPPRNPAQMARFSERLKAMCLSLDQPEWQKQFLDCVREKLCNGKEDIVTILDQEIANFGISSSRPEEYAQAVQELLSLFPDETLKQADSKTRIRNIALLVSFIPDMLMEVYPHTNRRSDRQLSLATTRGIEIVSLDAGWYQTPPSDGTSSGPSEDPFARFNERVQALHEVGVTVVSIVNKFVLPKMRASGENTDDSLAVIKAHCQIVRHLCPDLRHKWTSEHAKIFSTADNLTAKLLLCCIPMQLGTETSSEPSGDPFAQFNEGVQALHEVGLPLATIVNKIVRCQTQGFDGNINGPLIIFEAKSSVLQSLNDDLKLQYLEEGYRQVRSGAGIPPEQVRNLLTQFNNGVRALHKVGHPLVTIVDQIVCRQIQALGGNIDDSLVSSKEHFSVLLYLFEDFQRQYLEERSQKEPLSLAHIGGEGNVWLEVQSFIDKEKNSEGAIDSIAFKSTNRSEGSDVNGQIDPIKWQKASDRLLLHLPWHLCRDYWRAKRDHNDLRIWLRDFCKSDMEMPEQTDAQLMDIDEDNIITINQCYNKILLNDVKRILIRKEDVVKKYLQQQQTQNNCSPDEIIQELAEYAVQQFPHNSDSAYCLAIKREKWQIIKDYPKIRSAWLAEQAKDMSEMSIQDSQTKELISLDTHEGQKCLHLRLQELLANQTLPVAIQTLAQECLAQDGTTSQEGNKLEKMCYKLLLYSHPKIQEAYFQEAFSTAKIQCEFLDHLNDFVRSRQKAGKSVADSVFFLRDRQTEFLAPNNDEALKGVIKKREFYSVLCSLDSDLQRAFLLDQAGEIFASTSYVQATWRLIYKQIHDENKLIHNILPQLVRNNGETDGNSEIDSSPILSKIASLLPPRMLQIYLELQLVYYQAQVLAHDTKKTLSRRWPEPGNDEEAIPEQKPKIIGEKDNKNDLHIQPYSLRKRVQFQQKNSNQSLDQILNSLAWEFAQLSEAPSHPAAWEREKHRFFKTCPDIYQEWLIKASECAGQLFIPGQTDPLESTNEKQAVLNYVLSELKNKNYLTNIRNSLSKHSLEQPSNDLATLNEEMQKKKKDATYNKIISLLPLEMGAILAQNIFLLRSHKIQYADLLMAADVQRWLDRNCNILDTVDMITLGSFENLSDDSQFATAADSVAARLPYEQQEEYLWKKKLLSQEQLNKRSEKRNERIKNLIETVHNTIEDTRKYFDKSYLPLNELLTKRDFFKLPGIYPENLFREISREMISIAQQKEEIIQKFRNHRNINECSDEIRSDLDRLKNDELALIRKKKKLERNHFMRNITLEKSLAIINAVFPENLEEILNEVDGSLDFVRPCVANLSTQYPELGDKQKALSELFDNNGEYIKERREFVKNVAKYQKEISDGYDLQKNNYEEYKERISQYEEYDYALDFKLRPIREEFPLNEEYSTINIDYFTEDQVTVSNDQMNNESEAKTLERQIKDCIAYIATFQDKNHDSFPLKENDKRYMQYIQESKKLLDNIIDSKKELTSMYKTLLASEDIHRWNSQLSEIESRRLGLSLLETRLKQLASQGQENHRNLEGTKAYVQALKEALATLFAEPTKDRMSKIIQYYSQHPKKKVQKQLGSLLKLIPQYNNRVKELLSVERSEEWVREVKELEYQIKLLREESCWHSEELQRLQRRQEQERPELPYQYSLHEDASSSDEDSE